MRGRKYSTFYVAMHDDHTCGHQHSTVEKAVNCGGNAYRVIRRKLEGSKDVQVSFEKVKS